MICYFRFSGRLTVQYILYNFSWDAQYNAEPSVKSRIIFQQASIYDDIQKLEYLDAVLSESLRMYPPAWQ